MRLLRLVCVISRNFASAGWPSNFMESVNARAVVLRLRDQLLGEPGLLDGGVTVADEGHP